MIDRLRERVRGNMNSCLAKRYKYVQQLEKILLLFRSIWRFGEKENKEKYGEENEEKQNLIEKIKKMIRKRREINATEKKGSKFSIVDSHVVIRSALLR